MPSAASIALSNVLLVTEKNSPILNIALCLAAGAIYPLALSPFDLWPLALISITAFLYILVENRGDKWFRRFLNCLAYGVGQYAVGVSWLYESLHVFGNATPSIAVLFVAVFVAVYAVGFALLMSAAPVRGDDKSHSLVLLVFMWLLWEYFLQLDGLVFSFPWLLIGYAFIDTWLASFATLGGVTAVSLLAIVSCACLLLFRESVLAIVIFTLIWLGGWTLSQYDWTDAREEISVALVQGNLSLHEKWKEDGFQRALQTHTDLTVNYANDVDFVVWPEGALPVYDDQVRSHLRLVAEQIEGTLITGLFSRDLLLGEYYNSAAALRKDSPHISVHFKNKLVPFGEYLPLRSLTGPIADRLQMPMANLSPGPSLKRGTDRSFLFPGAHIGMYICYEIAYPSIVRSVDFKNGADFLLTISEDGWFGTTLGPAQHMQIARMRALETGRYLIRATSTGITAIVNPKGQIESRLIQQEADVLRGTIDKMEGMTLSNYLGSRSNSSSLWVVSVALLLLSWRKNRKDAVELKEMLELESASESDSEDREQKTDRS